MAHRDCRGSTGGCAYRPQPVPPIFAPEVAARAILFAATHRRREVWVGFPTVKAILAGRLAPGLSIVIWRGQNTAASLPASRLHPTRRATCSESVAGNWGAEGRFVNRERHQSWQMLATRQRGSAAGLLLAIGWLGYGAHYGFAGRRSDNARHTESCGLLSRTADCSPCWRCGLH